MENNHSLTVYFGEDYANLYTIGYVSSDIFQLLIFCELLQKGDKETVRKLYSRDSYRPYGFNRYNRVFKDNIKISKISDVKKGSVELIIAEATLAAAIIIPIVVVFLQNFMNQRNQRLTFNVNPNDIRLHNLINLYELGHFGNGREGLNEFFRELVRNGYNVQALGQDVYTIEYIANLYARRIARTLRMN